jgi:hypothetical protein
MSDTTALAAHIAALNAKTLAWVAESPSTRWACTFTEDLSHWAEDGITTPAQFDHHMLVSSVFECTREVWGYKPSWAGLMACTDAELKADLERLSQHAEEQREANAAYDAWMADFEKQQAWENPENELVFLDGCWK